MLRLLLSLLLAVVLLLAPCANAAELPRICSESVPIHVSIAATSLPPVGQTGTITVSVTADYALPAADVEIELPADGKVIGSAQVSLGAVPAAAPVTRSFSVVFNTPGDKLVGATVRAPEREGIVWSAVSYLGINIGPTRSQLGLVNTSPVGNATQRTAGNGKLVGTPPAILTRSAAPPQITAPIDRNAVQSSGGTGTSGMLTVKGNWTFPDRSGASAAQKDTIVELFRGGDNAHLAWAYTNWSGDYQFEAVTNPGTVGVYVQVSTWTNYGDGNYLSVINGSDEWNDRFRWNSGTLSFADGTGDMGSWTPYSTDVNRKAIWIKDDHIKSYWVPQKPAGGADLTGRHVGRWSSTSTDGTYYNGDCHYASGDADTTPDTILHEMGHSVMNNIYGGYWPSSPNCNPHYLMGSSSTGCGWTEGWAQTWHCWTTNDPIRSYPGGGGINLETATWGDGYDQGDTVEGRVAGAIWDITDSTNDGTDTYDGDWADVWDIMRNVTCDTFADFWSQWKSLGHYKHGAVASIYQCTIDYNTWPTFSGLPDVTTPEDTPVNNAMDLWLFAYDAESSDWDLVYTIIGDSNPGSNPSIDAGDYVDINPNANWYGSSTITVSCTDGIRTRTDSFNVNVTPVNDPPAITNLPDRSTNEDTAVNNAIDLWAWTSDPETSASGLTYAITGNTNTNCGATIDSNRYIDISPNSNWNGYSDVTVRATDPDGLSGYDTFRITVNPINDPPVVSGLPDRTMNEDIVWDNAIDLWGSTIDPETASSGLTYSIVVNTNTNCGVSIDSNRYIDISPAANWYGYSDVTVRATDPSGLTGQDTFRVTVLSINDPPVLSGLPDKLVAKNGSVNNAIDLWVYASDVETPDSSLIYTITGNTNTNCGATIDTGRYIDIAPTVGWTGYSDVTIRVTDADGLPAEDTFRIVVAQTYPTIAAARANADGTWVAVVDKLTAARFSSFYYIEEANRTSGIRVAAQGGPTTGVRVTVAGPLSTSFAERQITPYYLNTIGTGPIVEPLGMPNKSLGGGSPDAYTLAVPFGGKGLYNVGLLVRTTGRVLAHAGSRFYMADGSGVLDPSAPEPRVLVDSVPSGWLPPVGSYVAVTGISGASTMGGLPMRILRPVSENDVVVDQLKVAFIYGGATGTADANQFKSLLDANSLPTKLISDTKVAMADLSSYQVILVGSETAVWADPASVSAVLAPGTPIIGIGAGGSVFMDAVTTPDLYLGWLHSAVASGQTSAVVVDGNPGAYTYPYDLGLTPGETAVLYGRPGTSLVELYDPTPVTDHWLRAVGENVYYTLASEQNRFYQWGFYGAPDKMTALGGHLFVNLVFSTAR